MARRRGQAPPGKHHAHNRVAAGLDHVRRVFSVPLWRGPRVHRVCAGARLPQPVPVALPRVPAVQAPPAHCGRAGGRRARVVRRSHHQRGRTAGHPQAVLPRRCAHRRLCGLPECGQDQGHAQCHEVWHARRRGSHQSACGHLECQQHRPGGVPFACAQLLDTRGPLPRAQPQALYVARPPGGPAHVRHRRVCFPRQSALDAARAQARPPVHGACQQAHAHRLPQAGRQAVV
mmetsp:Transcript_20030/g.50816  ORF Transcript_20030/g.50816 Transcript_20030/m.50816 type:complete len:232 (+) Transcript_20030:823-1518(+)